MKDKIINRIYVLLALLALIIICLAGTNPYEKNIRLSTGHIASYCSGWHMIGENGSVQEISLPLYTEKAAGQTLTICKRMAGEADDGHYILLRDVHTHITVKVEGHTIYDYGGRTSKLFPTPGCGWLIIPLDSSYEGQILIIQSNSISLKYSGSIGAVYTGDSAGVLFYIIKANALGIITCMLILFFALMMFAGWLMTKKQFNNNNLLYLSLFELAIFVWSSNEAQVTQFIFGNMQSISVMTYEILILLPMPLLAYYSKSEQPEVRKICSRVSLLPIVNFIICNVLHFTGIMYFGDSLAITHICILIEAAYAIYGHVKATMSDRHDRHERRMGNRASMVGFLFLMAMVSADIIRYYFTEHFGDSSLCSRIGLLVYVLSLAIGTMRSGFGYMLGARQAEIYRQLAYTDNLTGLANRQAYEEKLREIAADQDKMHNLIAGMLDLNNLKDTNDRFGHAQGDRYIMGSSNYVNHCLRDIAQIYRIGGDEFAIIYTGSDSGKFHAAESYMLQHMQDEREVSVNFSYGSAQFDADLDHSPEDTFHRADEKMYMAKREYKESIAKKEQA